MTLFIRRLFNPYFYPIQNFLSFKSFSPFMHPPELESMKPKFILLCQEIMAINPSMFCDQADDWLCAWPLKYLMDDNLI